MLDSFHAIAPASKPSPSGLNSLTLLAQIVGAEILINADGSMEAAFRNDLFW
jgi:hypothetical protein